MAWFQPCKICWDLLCKSVYGQFVPLGKNVCFTAVSCCDLLCQLDQVCYLCFSILHIFTVMVDLLLISSLLFYLMGFLHFGSVLLMEYHFNIIIYSWWINPFIIKYYCHYKTSLFSYASFLHDTLILIWLPTFSLG
jgi:hypothetical protein